MRKNTKSNQKPEPKREPEHELEPWFDLDGIAEVEVTSEEWENPIENALVDGLGDGWRAADPGEQTISIRFAQPVAIDRIRLTISEKKTARTQEFVLRASSNNGKAFKEIVRQPFNFDPNGAVEETEDYRVKLKGVTVLELVIKPDISGGPACASLDRLRVAGSL